MKKKILYGKITSILFLVITLVLAGCQQNQSSESDTSQQQEEETIHQLEIPYENFRKVVGWVTNEEVLVHTGSVDEDQLAIYNLHTGKLEVIYSIPAFILSVELSHDVNKIALQVINDDASSVQVIDLEGNVLQTKEMTASSYIGIDWNPDDDNLIFLSYPQFVDEEEKLILEKWEVVSNESSPVETSSLDTRWYSSNLYLFVDHEGDETLEEGALYIGDIRTDEKLLINSQVSEFYLHEDAFVAMTPSDFHDDDLLLTYEYPFMVEQGYLTVPKVTMNERLMFPYLSQGPRNGAIYGVLPKERTLLEETVGEYELARLDFEEQAVHSLMDVPENAPISVSKNEQYTLFGWQYEYVIDLEDRTVHSLLPDENDAL